MLKSFTVDNFRAFSTPVTIDFSKTASYEFNTECIENGIAKKALLFGKNGTGKSSVALAIFDIVSNLTDNFMNRDNYQDYLNGCTNVPYATFSYTFQFDSDEIIYTYKKSSINTILAERVTINNENILQYDRTEDAAELYLNLHGTENLNKDLNLIKISVLKYIKSNTVRADDEQNIVLSKFFTFVDKMLLFWSLEKRSFIGYSSLPLVNVVEDIVKKNHFEDFQNFMKKAGFDDKLTHASQNGVEQLFFIFDNGNKVEFNSACSTGMSSLLLYYYWTQDISDENLRPSFICIDEFDAFYHYELSRFVAETLKRCNSQVLLTTHNTTLISNDILRPDCYFIVKKNSITNFSSLTDKELRQAHNIEKMYRANAFETE